MSHYSWFGLLANFVPCLIPPYAVKLTRSFGTRRVGWMLFGIFSLLAVLQLLRGWWPRGFGIEPALTVDLVNLLVSVLILIGMAHLESFLKERRRLDEQEKQLIAGLEIKVQQRTADLDLANEGLQREISLRKQGEGELKRSKEQYRFMFDENPQPMWLYDRASLKFLAFNAAALRFYGYTTAEFREMTARDLCAPGEAEGFVAESERPVPEVQPRAVRRHVRKDGSVMEVEMSALDLAYADTAARLVLVSDVTPQRLLQKQLLQNQKMAVTNQLAGGVADNFKQLIATIEADAAALASEAAGTNAEQPLRRIAATAAAAATLNRQLLALVRRHPMRAQAVDLNQFLEAQLPQLSRVLGNRIQVEKMCWAGLPPIAADPMLLEQIVRHLVLNARDAMPDGGTLTVCTASALVDENHARAHEDARPGAFVSLTVADTGCGMTPEVMARLFEPFFTTKDPAKATGLGLATVHGLVKQHSGWLEVSTKPGAGCRFTVFFPCTPKDTTRFIAKMVALELVEG